MEGIDTLPLGLMCRGYQHTYKIEKVLGKGSFGITYLATTGLQGGLGDIPVKVALKEFFADGLSSRDTYGRVVGSSVDSLAGRYGRAFMKEAINLSHLNHPGIVRVLEAFESNNTWYYSMEYLEGGSLDEFIDRKGRLSEPEALKMIRLIGDALSYLHINKMLHLDLKPKNIMLRENGQPVIIDFGLSKQYSTNQEAETSTTIGLGTPGYAPMEQSQFGTGRLFSPTLDIYALAGTLFKLLTGKTPPTSFEIFNNGFPSDELVALGVSPETIFAIGAGMAPQKNLRPQSVGDFILRLPSQANDKRSSPLISQQEENTALILEENHPIPSSSNQEQPNCASRRSGTRIWILMVFCLLALALFLWFGVFPKNKGSVPEIEENMPEQSIQQVFTHPKFEEGLVDYYGAKLRLVNDGIEVVSAGNGIFADAGGEDGFIIQYVNDNRVYSLDDVIRISNNSHRSIYIQGTINGHPGYLGFSKY